MKMSFREAVSHAFKNMFNFKGRARRKEFWCYFVVLTIALSIIGTVISSVAGLDTSSVTSYICAISLLLSLGVGVRRLHDTGKSGWWMLLELTGIGSFICFIFFLLDSTPGENKFGPNPKGVDAEKAKET